MIWRCDLVPQYEAYRQEIEGAIGRVLGSGKYVLGTEVGLFEREFAEYLAVGNVVGVANGTDALKLSLRALGIGNGDEVITTPFTAIPTVSAIIECGATPVFVDIEQDTFLIDLEKVAGAVTGRTRAVIPVHLFGNVVDIQKLRRVVGSDIAIVEDACQAHGSTIAGQVAGSMGDVGAFSFYPTKNLGGYGDGGAVASNSPELTARLRLLRSYGMVDYNHIVINGTNSRLDELQAAILRVKLRYLDAMNSKRRLIASRYVEQLPRHLFSVQAFGKDVTPNYHVFCSVYLGDRRKLIAHLEQREIQTNVYYAMPIYLQEANEYLGISKGACPTAEYLCDHVIALPMYPELDDKSLDQVIKAILSFRSP